MVRLGSALFAFPLQFSTALEWAGLCTCHYSCAASTAVTPEKLFHSVSLHQALAGSAPQLSMRGTSVLAQQTMKLFGLLKKGALIQNSCIRSFTGCADLNLAGLLCLVSQVQWRRQWQFSPANQWSAEFYMSCFGNGTVRLEPQPRWYWKCTRYCTQWKPPPQKWTVPNHTMQWKRWFNLNFYEAMEYFLCAKKIKMTIQKCLLFSVILRCTFTSVIFFFGWTVPLNNYFACIDLFFFFVLNPVSFNLWSHAFVWPVMILLSIFQGMWWTFRLVNGWESRAVSVQAWTRSMSTSSSPTSCLERKKTTGCSLQLMRAFRATWEEGDYNVWTTAVCGCSLSFQKNLHVVV